MQQNHRKREVLLRGMLLKWNVIRLATEQEKMKNKITQQNVSHRAIIACSPMFSISFFFVLFLIFALISHKISFHRFLFSPLCRHHSCYVYTLCHPLRVTCTEHSTRHNNWLTVNFLFLLLLFFLFFSCVWECALFLISAPIWTSRHFVATMNFIRWERAWNYLSYIFSICLRLLTKTQYFQSIFVCSSY